MYWISNSVYLETKFVFILYQEDTSSSENETIITFLEFARFCAIKTFKKYSLF